MASPDMKPNNPNDETRKTSLLRRLLIVALTGIAALVIVLGLLVVNNNYSLHRTSRQEFSSQTDQAIEATTKWITTHPDLLGNPSLVFMIADMEKMSGDPRLRAMLDGYLHSRYVQNPKRPISFVWARFADPQIHVPMLLAMDLGNIGFEERWDAYATAPDKVELTDADRADMFSPTKYTWGRRQHQLLALDIYRHYNGGSDQLNHTMNHLAEKVARDGYFDFRVNDSYYQRSAFVLGADRPDLIRSRWIERILDYQRADGSWAYCWYGWCRGIFEFRFGDYAPGHSSVQAAWALYMLKYRYPQWVEQHYQ
jgi:hypothetical protein